MFCERKGPLHCMDHQPGDIIRRRYQIISSLGGGGFGQTYLAEDRQLFNRKCVVKQLKPQPNILKVLPWADLKARFDKEADCLAKLGDHPQIPALLDKFEENQEFYFVQQFIDGAGLNKEIIIGQPWSEEKVIALLRNVLEILVFVHEQQVIHRDIKPDNLIRRKVDGKLVLIDFGAIKEIRNLTLDPNSNTIIQTIAIGTKGYMPVELVNGNPRFISDLYALGVTAIQALKGVSSQELLKELKTDPQTGELSWREGVPVSDALAAIIDKMVRCRFTERYQSATEVLEDLQNLQHPGSSPVPPPPPPQPPVRGWIRFAILVIAGALLFVAAKVFPIAQALWFYSQAKNLFAQEKYPEAIAACEKATTIKPNFTEAWERKGIALIKHKQPNEALESCEQAIKIEPDFAAAWICKGQAIYDLKRYQEAIDAYDRAIQLKPTHYAWNNKCEALLEFKEAQKYKEAIQACEEAIKLNSTYHPAWNNKGKALLGLQQCAEAKKAFQEALNIEPNYSPAKENLKLVDRKCINSQ